MSEELSFDFHSLKEVIIPVTLHNGQQCYLVEASAGAAKTFINARTSKIKLGGGGDVKELGNLGDLEPLLVSLCLFEAVEGRPGRPITLTEVERFPYRVLKQLFDKAKEISGLDGEQDSLSNELKDALSQSDAPTSLESFQQWASGLDGTKYKAVQRLAKSWDKDNSPKA